MKKLIGIGIAAVAIMAMAACEEAAPPKPGAEPPAADAAAPEPEPTRPTTPAEPQAPSSPSPAPSPTAPASPPPASPPSGGDEKCYSGAPRFGSRVTFQINRDFEVGKTISKIALPTAQGGCGEISYRFEWDRGGAPPRITYSNGELSGSPTELGSLWNGIWSATDERGISSLGFVTINTHILLSVRTGTVSSSSVPLTWTPSQLGTVEQEHWVWLQDSRVVPGVFGCSSKISKSSLRNPLPSSAQVTTSPSCRQRIANWSSHVRLYENRTYRFKCVKGLVAWAFCTQRR